MTYLSQKDMKNLGKLGPRSYLNRWLGHLPEARRDTFAAGYRSYRKFADQENPDVDYSENFSRLIRGSKLAEPRHKIMASFGAAARCFLEEGSSFQATEFFRHVKESHMLRELYAMLDGEGVRDGKEKYREIVFTANKAHEIRDSTEQREKLRLPKKTHGPFEAYVPRPAVDLRT